MRGFISVKTRPPPLKDSESNIVKDFLRSYSTELKKPVAFARYLLTCIGAYDLAWICFLIRNKSISDFNDDHLFHKISPGVLLICGQSYVQRMGVTWCVCLKNKESQSIVLFWELSHAYITIRPYYIVCDKIWFSQLHCSNLQNSGYTAVQIQSLVMVRLQLVSLFSKVVIWHKNKGEKKQSKRA